MRNKFIFLVFLLSLSWILFVNGSAINQTYCPPPSSLKKNYAYNWQSQKNEWRNTKSKVDFIVLDLIWTPTHCLDLPEVVRDTKFRCNQSDLSGLVAYGLWLSTFGATSMRDQPRNCRNEPQIPLSVIKRFYCFMFDDFEMQSEYAKHGSCYYKTATDYFTAIKYLFNQLNKPDIRAMKQPTSLSIKNAFLALNSRLFSSAIIIFMNNQGQLSEIRICYNLRYKFTSCAQ